MLPRTSCVILLALLARAEKKIELEDIEEDNLKSEKAKEYEKSDRITTTQNPVSLDFFNHGFFKYFETPSQQSRFVQQYAVSEPPEKGPTPKPEVYKPVYQTTHNPQQAMVGYLSNVPMQIYLVPQYDATSPSSGHHFPEPPQISYPDFRSAPVAKTYVSQAQFGPVTYQSQPTPAPQVLVQSPAPVFAFPMPMSYPHVIATPPVLPKEYYPQTAETKDIDAVSVHGNGIESAVPQTTAPRHKDLRPYGRIQLKEEQSDAAQDPRSYPLIFRGHPPFAQAPTHLPLQFRGYPKPAPPQIPPGMLLNYTPHPNTINPYNMPRRRPNSLIDSYVPSHVQLEYMKRGYAKDPPLVYEHLSKFPNVSPRHIERGFLPNQMYPTAAGGVTFGHYKRTPKQEPRQT